MSDPVLFFDTQFQHQILAAEFMLNPFELAALPYLKGRVLDLGCGLGNLSLEAGRRRCNVLAVDASPTAVGRINQEASANQLNVHAVAADVSDFVIPGIFDTVVSIGLLMFFPREKALGLLDTLKACVDSGGCAVINALIEGTTYLEMFRDDHYTLFGRNELEQKFDSWEICLSRHDDFEAPGGRVKAFSTVIARKPSPALQ